jgi:hypothetical protein
MVGGNLIESPVAFKVFRQNLLALIMAGELQPHAAVEIAALLFAVGSFAISVPVAQTVLRQKRGKKKKEKRDTAETELPLVCDSQRQLKSTFDS